MVKKRKKRASPQWRKLIIDGKLVWVFPRTKVPRSVKKLIVCKGIEMKKSNRDERKPYLLKEKGEKNVERIQ